jgi:type II secretory pathway component PulC
MNMQSDNEPMNNTETEENQVQLIQSEENQEINTDETSFPDVSNYTKEELLSELKGIVINPSELSKLAGFLRELKEQFDNLFESDKQEALQSFIQEGGNKDDFHFKKDETSLAFENE